MTVAHPARRSRRRTTRRSPRSRRSLPALAVVARRRGASAHDLHGAWPFLLAGLLAPGCSQILFTLAVREIGASRTSVAVGCAPLARVAIALVFLDEPLSARCSSARSRSSRAASCSPSSATGPGICARAASSTPRLPRALFATRDNLVRALHAHANPETAAAATLLAGAAGRSPLDAAGAVTRATSPRSRSPACCSGSPTSASSRPTGADA